MRQFVLVPLAVGCLLSAAAGQSYIGRVDTIGGTTYDWWRNGCAAKSLANAPQYGLHAAWVYSTETSNTTFPDRNVRYNFYDFAARTWNWIDPDYMQSGVNVFTHRAGYGNLDAVPLTGEVVIAGTGGGNSMLARDVAPGAGIFDYLGDSTIGLSQWPLISVGQNGTIHVLMMTAAYGLAYTRLLPGNPHFDSLRVVDPSGGFPTHNIAASKVSGKVCLIWESSTSIPEGGYMQTSTDNGDTWTESEQFLPPDAFGGDTVTSFHITSLYPFYDYEDRLHVVANVSPIVHDTTYVAPSEIWHWCPDNTPQWNRIHVASCRPEHMQASVGYNATYADRPSIGEGHDGLLYVAWEQFDSSNVEPLTQRLRAGIWFSGSPDNGLTWTPGVLVTGRNSFSHRFPSISDRMVSGEGPSDVLPILYLMDSVAGFFVQNEGPATFDPVVCQFVPTWMGVQEAPSGEGRMANVGPTILSGAAGSKGLASTVIFDVMGRRVLKLRSGVYFVRAVSGKLSAAGCQKVVVTR
jgi:hypothetical protein